MLNKLNKKLEKQDLPTTLDDLLKTLDKIGVAYMLHHHDPIFTVEEGLHLKISISGVHCRNLFLRDRKKKMFLVVVPNDTSVDLKSLQEALDCGRLSFGSPERLWQYLGIRPGSVCPFTVINDTDHAVSVVLDQKMMEAELVNYHPLDNAMTISLTPVDLMKFLDYTGHKPQIVDLTLCIPQPT